MYTTFGTHSSASIKQQSVLQIFIKSSIKKTQHVQNNTIASSDWEVRITSTFYGNFLQGFF